MCSSRAADSDCSLPPCGGGLGEGGRNLRRALLLTPHPTAFACASAVDLPRKGGGEKRGHSRHIAPQDRRQIGIHHRGVAAADQLDQRRHFVADRHLREAHVARQCGDLLLVVRIAIGVHEHDRHRADAVRLGRAEIALHRVENGRALDRAVGAHALVHFGDALVQHVRLDDVAGENFRPRLVADLERVAKTLGDQQERAVTLALEQGVGGDRGAHLHRADAAGRDRLARR